MVLTDVLPGERVKLVSVKADGTLESHLAGMGMAPGSEIQMLSNIPGRPLVVCANGSRLSICQKVARNIQVRLNGTEQTEFIHNSAPNICESGCHKKHGLCRGGAKQMMNKIQCADHQYGESDLSPVLQPRQCKKLCPLRQMQVNQTGIIRSVKARGELGRRIRDMGLVPNTEVTVVGRAPLKDPVALRLRDFTLSLRNSEADYITVEVAGG